MTTRVKWREFLQIFCMLDQESCPKRVVAIVFLARQRHTYDLDGFRVSGKMRLHWISTKVSFIRYCRFHALHHAGQTLPACDHEKNASEIMEDKLSASFDF